MGPEATVNEHRQPIARKDEIGVVGKPLPVETKTKTWLVCGLAEHEFKSGVLLDPGHHLTSPPTVHEFGHDVQP